MPGKIVPAAPVPPFVTFVASAVPMVFDNSMSYYEALCALWKWLQDDVIDVINNNATVTNEYIDLTNEYTAKFIELKNYVDNYFDNLDVQQEINNKLDEMAEDGTLTRLLADYLKTQIIYDSTEDMIDDADNLVDGIRVETLGYHAENDGGASFFVIKNSGTADGYSVIDLDNGLYAHMISRGDTIRPEQFGAYGDGTHDDSAAIQAAFDTGKVVEFSEKTYLCFSLTSNYGNNLVIHGNGCTLKRPNLSVDPYNYTVEQMKWIATIGVYSDATIKDVIFDNNCFTMWQVSDGYAQQQACSVIVRNADHVIDFTMDNCEFRNSAGDGLHVVNNVNANITNCRSKDCFRGGFTSTGYGSEINLNGWDSKVITTGVNDGFDVEVDSASTINPNKYILNISNVVLDYDLDIMNPAHGLINMNNVVMREYDQDNITGFYISTDGGTTHVCNSVLRGGKLGTIQTMLHADGKISYENCKFIGNSTEAIFKTGVYSETTFDSLLYFNNCEARCHTFMEASAVYGSVCINNCNIVCQGQLIKEKDNNTVQMCGGLIIQNSNITFGSRLLDFGKNAYAPNGVSRMYLSNLQLNGASGSDLRIAGSPEVYYNGLVMESACKTVIAGGGNPKFYGDRRVIMVGTATDLNFAGWVPGNDIAIAKDTGVRYQYTSGTTWTAI